MDGNRVHGRVDMDTAVMTAQHGQLAARRYDDRRRGRDAIARSSADPAIVGDRIVQITGGLGRQSMPGEHGAERGATSQARADGFAVEVESRYRAVLSRGFFKY